jgi:FMN-dependent NADH-azoreductase
MGDTSMGGWRKEGMREREREREYDIVEYKNKLCAQFKASKAIILARF